jgi:hypothetical protein
MWFLRVPCGFVRSRVATLTVINLGFCTADFVVAEVEAASDRLQTYQKHISDGLSGGQIRLTPNVPYVTQ